MKTHEHYTGSFALVTNGNVAVSYTSPAGWENGKRIPGVRLSVRSHDQVGNIIARYPGDDEIFASQEDAKGFALDQGYLKPHCHPLDLKFYRR